MVNQRGTVDGRSDARQSPRRQVQFNALIRAGSNRSASVQVQNISASGALVHNGDATLFKAGEVVEFFLHYHRSGKPSELHLSATVVRSDSSSVALKFGRYDSMVYTDLIELIYGTGGSS